MAGASLLGNVRSDPLAIVANSQANRPLVKIDFRVNMSCTSVGESIAQRLARDTVNFVPNDGIQVPYRAFYNHTEGRGVPACEFVSHRAYGLHQIPGREPRPHGRGAPACAFAPHRAYGLHQIAGSERRPQVLHRLAALGDRLVTDFQSL